MAFVLPRTLVKWYEASAHTHCSSHISNKTLSILWNGSEVLKEIAQVEQHGAEVSAPDFQLYMQDRRITPSPTSCFNNPSWQRSINGCQLNEQSAATQNIYENVHKLHQNKHTNLDG